MSAPMGIRLLAAGVRSDDPGPGTLRYASVNGRQLWAMATGWPALADRTPVTGVYQAMGLEKRQVFAADVALVEAHGGFDALKPASMIFEHMPLGPFAQLAVAAEAVGPFYTLEGDAIAGGMALLTALEDLATGQAQRALVGGYRLTAPRAWLALLAADPGRATRWKAVFTHGRKAPDAGDLAALQAALGQAPALVPGDPVADPLGLAAHFAMLEAAEAGGAHAVWSCAADGRGLLLGVRHDAVGHDAG